MKQPSITSISSMDIILSMLSTCHTHNWNHTCVPAICLQSRHCFESVRVWKSACPCFHVTVKLLIKNSSAVAEMAAQCCVCRLLFARMRLVKNTTLTYILSRTVSKLLRVIGQIFASGRKGTSLQRTRSGWTPELTTTKFRIKKLETSLYRMVGTYISISWSV